jgi:hypothetical protein
MTLWQNLYYSRRGRSDWLAIRPGRITSDQVKDLRRDASVVAELTLGNRLLKTKQGGCGGRHTHPRY